MSKPSIFLSHIGEERDLAGIFKRRIESSFLGLVDVFVSSDAESIGLGSNWLDRVTQGLRSCQAMLLLCSPVSIHRPWINFEAGAGWARAIEVAPICHSGLRPVELPLPMSLLQGIEASDEAKIWQVFGMIARNLGSKEPTLDVPGMVAEIRNFERRYLIEIQLGTHIRGLKSAAPSLLEFLAKLSPDITQVIQNVPEQLIVSAKPHLDALQESKALQYSYGVMGIGFGQQGGNFGDLTISLSERLVAAIPS